jgi:hypothetical protein
MDDELICLGCHRQLGSQAEFLSTSRCVHCAGGTGRRVIRKTSLEPDDGLDAELALDEPALGPMTEPAQDAYMADLGWKRSPRVEGDRINVQTCSFCTRAVTSEEIRYTLLLSFGFPTERAYCCSDCVEKRLPSTPKASGML